MVYLAKHNLQRSNVIDILADQSEDNMEIKVQQLMKHVQNEESFTTATMNKIVSQILENIDEHEDQLGPTQKMRYEVSRVTDCLLLGDEFVDQKSSSALKYKEELKNVTFHPPLPILTLKQVKLDIIHLRKIVDEQNFEVSSFDKDEIYNYDLKTILDLALPDNKISSQAIYLICAHLYTEDWITDIPKVMECFNTGLGYKSPEVEAPKKDADAEDYGNDFDDYDMDEPKADDGFDDYGDDDEF